MAVRAARYLQRASIALGTERALGIGPYERRGAAAHVEVHSRSVMLELASPVAAGGQILLAADRLLVHPMEPNNRPATRPNAHRTTYSISVSIAPVGSAMRVARATAGMTILRPKRSDGRSPVRTHS